MTTCLEGCVTLCVEAPCSKPTLPSLITKNVFDLSHDLARPRYHAIKLLIVCEHSAKFGGHNHSSSADLTYLICHVTLQHHRVL